MPRDLDQHQLFVEADVSLVSKFPYFAAELFVNINPSFFSESEVPITYPDSVGIHGFGDRVFPGKYSGVGSCFN